MDPDPEAIPQGVIDLSSGKYRLDIDPLEGHEFSIGLVGEENDLHYYLKAGSESEWRGWRRVIELWSAGGQRPIRQVDSNEAALEQKMIESIELRKTNEEQARIVSFIFFYHF